MSIVQLYMYLEFTPISCTIYHQASLVPRSSNTTTCNTLAVIEGLGTRLPSSAFYGWMRPCHIVIQPLLLAVSNDMGKDDCWSVSYPSLICKHFPVFCGPVSLSGQFP